MITDKYTVIARTIKKKKKTVTESCLRKFLNNIYKQKRDPGTMSYLRWSKQLFRISL